MNALNGIKSPIKNKNIFILSKEAINYLDNQIIKDGENRTIEAPFTFQVVYAIKKFKDWYCCCLMDQKSKYGGFCIKYNKRYGEPKEGDIIKTKKIQIVKLPNRDNNLYFCDNVKKLEESKKMIINPQSVDSVTKVRSTSKKKAYLKYNIFQNYNGEEDDNIYNEININSPNQDRLINIENKILSENRNKIVTPKKPILISDLTSFTNNPFFILKFIAKSDIKIFSSKYNLIGMDYVQNYVFSDINGDKIQAVAYSYDTTQKFDKLLKINSIYKISRVNKKTNFRNEFNITNTQIQLTFNFNTKIEELTEEERKSQGFKDKNEFTKIKDLLNKENKVFNIYGIILDDKGIIEKKKINNNEIIKYRRLIIGDDSLHKVNLILWEDSMLDSDNLYFKGDIVCAKDFKYKSYYFYYQLNSSFASKFEYLTEPKVNKRLKKFYSKHQKIEEYTDLTFLELNNRKDIKHIFIEEFLDEFEAEIQKQSNYNNNKCYKINGIVVNIEHGDNNVFSGCKFCGKKFDEICPSCNTYNKKLFLDFWIQIKDCSNQMWIRLSGECAENFLGITPEEYQLLIKYNNKYKLAQIEKRFLYYEFIFIGKNNSPTLDDFRSGGFSVFQYKRVDKDYFRQLINLIGK